MKPIIIFKEFIAKYPKKDFDQLSTLLLAILGSSAFIVAAYCGHILNEFTPPLIKASNTEGFTLIAVYLWSIVGFIAITCWLYGCIAARCHSILYDRLFK